MAVLLHQSYSALCGGDNLSWWGTSSPRTRCPGGQLVLGPHVRGGQLVLRHWIKVTWFSTCKRGFTRLVDKRYIAHFLPYYVSIAEEDSETQSCKEIHAWEDQESHLVQKVCQCLCYPGHSHFQALPTSLPLPFPGHSHFLVIPTT